MVFTWANEPIFLFFANRHFLNLVAYKTGGESPNTSCHLNRKLNAPGEFVYALGNLVVRTILFGFPPTKKKKKNVAKIWLGLNGRMHFSCAPEGRAAETMGNPGRPNNPRFRGFRNPNRVRANRRVAAALRRRPPPVPSDEVPWPSFPTGRGTLQVHTRQTSEGGVNKRTGEEKQNGSHVKKKIEQGRTRTRKQSKREAWVRGTTEVVLTHTHSIPHSKQSQMYTLALLQWLIHVDSTLSHIPV